MFDTTTPPPGALQEITGAAVTATSPIKLGL